MAIPITINCECTRTIEADLGDRVTCECGREYDTSKVPRQSAMAAHSAQLQFRLIMWVGMVLIAGAAIGGYLFHGIGGALLAVPAVAAFWFGVVRPRVRRRQQKALAEMPSWSVEAQ
jgi:hypothetical protein